MNITKKFDYLKKKLSKTRKKMKKAGAKKHTKKITEDTKQKLQTYIIEENIDVDKIPAKKIKEILDKFNIYSKSGEKKEELIKLLKNPTLEIDSEFTSSSNIMSRLSTMQYEGIKDYVNKQYEINQPNFKPEDQLAKENIWKCQEGTSCFSDIACNKDKGDHIYGVREGLKNYGIIGSNSKWNMIPCTQKENTSWKKIGGKNLVYDTFTIEEIENFNEFTKEKYNKLQEWKQYCDKQGAKLYWINGLQINRIITEIVNPLLEDMNVQIQEVSYIDQDSIIESTNEDKEMVLNENLEE
jgi:hypothetical protein